MKITAKDVKKGIIKLIPMNTDDLWLLSQVINRNSLASAKTTRKIKLSETKVEKKTFYVQISIEKIDFSNDMLRISGKTTTEQDEIPKGSYQSISIGPHDELKIQQKWLKYQIEKLEQAAKDKPNILLVVLDRESVFFAKMDQQGYKTLSNFEGDVDKKIDGRKVESLSNKGKSNKGDFYSQINQKLKEYDDRLKVNRIVLASPAFFKEDFLKQLSDDKLKKKIVLATCSSVSTNAFDEILKRDEVKKALSEERLKDELDIVEELFVEIGKDGKFSYGFDDVKKNVEAGSVKDLLVSSNLINKYREEENFEELEQIMMAVEQLQGKITIINSQNEAGKKLDGISGIGALLRYKV